MNLRGAGRLARRHDQTTAARKVALVTGAGKRLGRAIALALAERGWDIVVHYRHSEDDADMTALDIEALGRRALLLQCDLSDEAAVRTMLARTAGFGAENHTAAEDLLKLLERRIPSLAEKLRHRVLQTNFIPEDPLQITASFGVAEFGHRCDGALPLALSGR